MSEEIKRKRLNEEHPDHIEYMKKFHAIWDVYFKMEEEERAKYPNWEGRDHPAYIKLRPAHRKCCEETRALQQEYSHLFTEEYEENEEDNQ